MDEGDPPAEVTYLVTGPGVGHRHPARDIGTLTVGAARSRYLGRARRPAPEHLVGRETELAWLAAFCAAGDDAPAYAWWLGMLAEAAEVSRSRGERLVPVVDGLDEDQGVGAVPGLTRNIAALLPSRPAAGCASSWPAARAHRIAMGRELDRLPHGGPGERDLVALTHRRERRAERP